MKADHVYRAQSGAQTRFLATKADIAIYGGAAGSGKTYAELLESLRHHLNPLASCVMFRRESTQITNPGGLWDESSKMFPHFGAKSNQQSLQWIFPSGYKVKMSHLQHEKDKYNWQGSQIPIIIFDEVTHFTESQFWYLLSRNRSDSGVKGYVRATCNPDANSWVKNMISWYLDDNGQYPVKWKSGILRYFVRLNDQLFWSDDPEKLKVDYDVKDVDIKSFTFIPATIEDNQILLQNDPAYLSNLRALPEVEKERLLMGNWAITNSGNIFKQSDFKSYVIKPAKFDYMIMTVDTAQKTKEHNDYTVMQAWGLVKDKGIYLMDQVRGKFEFPDLKIMFESFSNKYPYNKIYVEDAVSGTALIQSVKMGLTRPIETIIRTKDKYTRAFDVSGYVQSGYVYLNPMSEYYTDLIAELVAFSADGSHKHDDQVDCLVDAVDKLLINKPVLVTDTINLTRRKIA